MRPTTVSIDRRYSDEGAEAVEWAAVQARLADALDQSGIVNVAMAEPPVVPALPASSAWTLLAIGLVAAGTAGTGAAFAADYADPAFRTPDDVVGYLHAPVLASLPRMARGGLSA